MMFGDLATVTGSEGCFEEYSESEFKNHLKVDLLSKKCWSGWVFGKQYSEYEELVDTSLVGFLFSSEVTDKITRVLEKLVSFFSASPYFLFQFWAPLRVDQHLYLTTAEQPFSVTRLSKGVCWHREHCMGHRYRVDERAQEEELGAVGRVYRNKHPESTPDLRLYSTKEFPLRDAAACSGARGYLALPVFDSLKENCYGVIEVLSRWVPVFTNRLEHGLEAADLRTTHLNSYHPPVLEEKREIAKMLELAITVVPQLQLTQVWMPCQECSNLSQNLSCMEIVGVRRGWYDYCQASQYHHLQIGKCTNMIAAVMSSNKKACISQNICDFSISENPLAHYAQKANFSLCFAICLESLKDRRDFYVVEFFIRRTSVSAFVGSFLPLLLRIMEMKLKNYNFAYKGQHGEEIVVEVLKDNVLSSGESSQSNVLRYESVKYKLQRPQELSMLVVKKGRKKTYSVEDFTEYLQKADLHWLQPSRRCGWVFWSLARQELLGNEVNSNSSTLPDTIQGKIKHLMSEITSKWKWASYALAQFWAPKTDVDRCYLEALGQPFALGCLHKGLAYFRKQCMEHHYYVDDRAREEELGPPGRVFLNKHPEVTDNLHLYTTAEFPLRDHATHCGLRKYFALPIFDLEQHKCVGVLELVQCSMLSLDVIKNALEAANLSSTHISFKQSFLQSHPSCKEALAEIQEACELFSEIPQLRMVDVWVPYNECPGNNNTVSCMERVWSTKELWKYSLRMCQFQHVVTRKGIAGMALASKNKSCFCRDLCEFSIAEQPLAHYRPQDGSDVCFAICLQSCHTGDLLYILEFYLNQGPERYEYHRSFLCFLLEIMKQKLGSFIVASGQQLGEKLVVEVIKFSEVDEPVISEIDQPDSFPITFKFVKYGGRKLSKDKQVLFAADCMESVTSTAQTEHCCTSANNVGTKDAAKKSKGGRTKTRQKDFEDKQVHFPSDADIDSTQENASNKTKRGKRKTGHLNIKLQDLEPYFGQKLEDVAEQLGVSRSTIKRICRDNGIQRWPSNENYKKNPSFYMGESAEESAQDSQQNMCPSPFSNLPHSNMPLQNAPHTNPESSQGLIYQAKDDMAVIKATYEGYTVKFQLHNSAGMEKLAKEVAMRLNLEMGSFKLLYLDEDNDKILLTCDADLQFCLKSLVAVGKTFIQMFVQ